MPKECHNKIMQPALSPNLNFAFYPRQLNFKQKFLVFIIFRHSCMVFNAFNHFMWTFLAYLICNFLSVGNQGPGMLLLVYTSFIRCDVRAALSFGKCALLVSLNEINYM